MYNELIEIKKDGNVFLQDDSIALMPNMWRLYKDRKGGSNQIRWIVSVFDYKSPLRRLPEEERKAQASYNVFKENKNPRENTKVVQDAIMEYRKYQYDPLIDQYNSMSEQMFKMNEIYRAMKPTTKNLEEMNKLQGEMAKAAKARDAIKELILKDQETETKIQGTSSDDFSIFEDEQRMG